MLAEDQDLSELVNVEHPDDQITLPVDTLQIVLEIGEEIGDSTEIFGSIIDADIDKQGRIYVLDQVSCRIMIYDMQVESQEQ